MSSLLLAIFLAAAPKAPALSPAEGTYSSTQSVTARATTAGSVIYCTTDGSTPTRASTRYTGALSVSSTATVKCSAWKRTGPRYFSSPVASATYTITGGGGTPADLYAAAQSTCSGMALRSTGTVHYFCECSTGAETGCTAGNDANDGLSPANAKRTWAAVRTAFNAMSAGDTIALCKGGFWNVPALSGDCDGAISNASCSAASDSTLLDAANTTTCDIRDYQASWGGTVRPVLYASDTTGTNRFFSQWGSATSGVRVMNLEFRGQSDGPAGTNHYSQNGMVWGACSGTASDSYWLICNNKFIRLANAFMPSLNSAAVTHFNIWGNRFELNWRSPIQGGPGSYGKIDANYFENNAGITQGNQQHTIYLGSAALYENTNVSVINNEIRRPTTTGEVGQCENVTLMSHDYFTNLTVENNIVDCGAYVSANHASCWGIQFSAGGSQPTHFRNATFRRNQTINCQTAIAISSAPGVVIENNIVYMPTQGGVAITSPDEAYRATVDGYATGDDRQDNGTVRNNTVYTTGTTTPAIKVNVEGTGHVIANNAIYTGGGTCFETSLAAGAYTFVGNNACYGGTWGTTYDSTTHVTTNPNFVNAPTDFTPDTGSPLIGAGSNTYKATVDFFNVTRPSPPAIGAVEP